MANTMIRAGYKHARKLELRLSFSIHEVFQWVGDNTNKKLRVTTNIHVEFPSTLQRFSRRFCGYIYGLPAVSGGGKSGNEVCI